MESVGMEMGRRVRGVCWGSVVVRWGIVGVAGYVHCIFRDGGFGGIEIDLCTAGVELRVWRIFIRLMESEKFGPGEVIPSC